MAFQMLSFTPACRISEYRGRLLEVVGISVQVRPFVTVVCHVEGHWPQRGGESRRALYPDCGHLWYLYLESIPRPVQ